MEQLWDIGIGKYKILCVAEHITCYHLFWLVKILYRNSLDVVVVVSLLH